MKMKPIIEASWNLQNIAKRDSKQKSQRMGPMIGIGLEFCCAC